MLKKLLLSTVIFFNSISYSQQEDLFPIDSIPYDAIINSTLGGKRMKYFGTIDLNFNQAFFENWISGGESSFTGLFNLDYNLNYSDRKGWVWDNNLMISIGGNRVSGGNILKKADDRFQINSQLGKQINMLWNYSFYIDLRTQLLPGYRYFKEDGVEKKEKLSRIFSPTIVQMGLGCYFKKSTDFWINLSPVSGRGIFVGSGYTKNLAPNKSYFGVKRGKTSSIFLGSSINGFLKFWLMENISMTNKFNFYVNYIQNIQNVDFELNSTIKMKVNKKISSNLIVHLMYDDDIISDLQIRELFGVGLSVDL